MPTKATKVRLLTHTQSCRYCHQDFVPTRRGTQQYCSASCRTSYCRKKKQGTLHRLQRLPGPASSSAPSFKKLFLAAAAGSVTDNAAAQTADYHLVTKGLLAQIAQLQAQLHQQLRLNQQQGQLLARLQHDQQRLLQALGVPPEPLPDPHPQGDDVADLPLPPAAAGSASAWSLEEFGPSPLPSDWSPVAAGDVAFSPAAACTPPVG